MAAKHKFELPLWYNLGSWDDNVLNRKINWKIGAHADFNQQGIENLYDSQNLLPFLHRKLKKGNS